MTEFRHLFMYALGAGFNLVLVYTFWRMLMNGSPVVLLNTNRYGEYWFEFFLLNGIFILQIIMLILQLRDYFRS